MREPVDAGRVRRVMAALGRAAVASPADFIPLPPGWEARSPLITRVGRAAFHHFDPYAQALAKVERGHARDLDDVHAMLARGLVDPAEALRLFDQIEPQLYRFPGIDPPSFRRAAAAVFGGAAR